MCRLSPVTISLYIVTVCAFGFVAVSLVSVAPKGELTQQILMGIWAVLAFLFAVLALILKWVPGLRAKWLVRMLLGAATLVTVAFILIGVG